MQWMSWQLDERTSNRKRMLARTLSGPKGSKEGEEVTSIARVRAVALTLQTK